MSDPDLREAEKVTIFSRAILKEGTWYTFQEVEGFLVEGSDQTYKKDGDSLTSHYVGLRLMVKAMVVVWWNNTSVTSVVSKLCINCCSSVLVVSRVLFGKRAGAVLDIDDIPTTLKTVYVSSR